MDWSKFDEALARLADVTRDLAWAVTMAKMGRQATPPLVLRDEDVRTVRQPDYGEQ